MIHEGRWRRQQSPHEQQHLTPNWQQGDKEADIPENSLPNRPVPVHQDSQARQCRWVTPRMFDKVKKSVLSEFWCTMNFIKCVASENIIIMVHYMSELEQKLSLTLPSIFQRAILHQNQKHGGVISRGPSWRKYKVGPLQLLPQCHCQMEQPLEYAWRTVHRYLPINVFWSGWGMHTLSHSGMHYFCH